MPTSKKASSTQPPATPVVRNRNAAIRNDRRYKADAAAPDARDAALHSAPLATTKSLDISRSPDRGQALELAQQLQAIVVTDLESHRRAKELMGVGKQIKRKMVEHWQRITRSIDDLKRTITGFRDDDFRALDAGMAAAEKIVLEYEEADERRRRAEDDRLREERERAAREERERELAAADAKALELEESSKDLSARELWFVEGVFKLAIDVANPTALDMAAMLKIVKQAGYKDADTQVARLLRSQKILDAIKGKNDAAAIRQQAEARRSQPVDIVDAPPAESNIARGGGLPATKTYYSAEVVDVEKLRDAFAAGKVNGEALIPNMPYLNSQARASKSAEIFGKAFPGCRLKKDKSI